MCTNISFDDISRLTRHHQLCTPVQKLTSIVCYAVRYFGDTSKNVMSWNNATQILPKGKYCVLKYPHPPLSAEKGGVPQVVFDGSPNSFNVSFRCLIVHFARHFLLWNLHPSDHYMKHFSLICPRNNIEFLGKYTAIISSIRS